MQKAVAMPPTSTWPSAPMFQNRMAKAGASPTPIHSSIMASRMVIQVRLGVPKAPDHMALYTLRGFIFTIP